MTKEEAFNIWKKMTVKEQMELLKMIPKKRTIADKQMACILHIKENF